MNINDTKQEILELVETAVSQIPRDILPDLPPTKDLPNVPGWHSFEWSIWKIGESIRTLLTKHSLLRKDNELQDLFLVIAEDRRAKRGRQSFFFLLGYKACARCALGVARQLDDPCVAGHAIKALRRMGVGDFTSQVRALVDHPTTWVRNEAKKYISRFNANA